MNQHINIEDYLEPTDPPLPLPAIETLDGANTIDSTETLGEATVTQGYRVPIQSKQRTENLFNKDAPYTASKYLNASGEEVSGSTWGISEYIPIEGNTTYTAYNLNGGGASACWYDKNKTYINGEAYNGASSKSFSLPSNAKYIRFTIRLLNPPNIDTLMLIKGSTSPENYIPYYNITEKDIYIGDSPLIEGQSINKNDVNIDIPTYDEMTVIDTTLVNKPQVDLTYQSSVLGVGEKTKNLFNKANCGRIQVDTYGTLRFGSILYGVENGEYTLVCNNQSGRTLYLQTLTNGTYTSVNVTSQLPYTFTVQDIDALILRSTTNQGTDWDTLGVYDIMLIKGSTAPLSYIPYGYQIPLLVTSGQQSTPHTIYIGDSPLTAGQSVTKASSSTDITLYQGENTISTTLGNKPEMKIDYESTEVGVGERTENLLDLSKHTYSSGISDVVIDEATGALSFTGTGTNRSVNFFATDLGVEMYGKTYIVSCVNNLASTTEGRLAIRKATTHQIVERVSFGSTGEKSITFTPDEETFPNGWYISVLATGSTSTTGNVDIFQLMLCADTTPDFEPYGYQIPIDIKQDDEVVDHKDIYIGTQPLEEGASVNKVSVGEDITLASGNNYIDTDLFNKPEMYIK